MEKSRANRNINKPRWFGALWAPSHPLGAPLGAVVGFWVGLDVGWDHLDGFPRLHLGMEIGNFLHWLDAK